MLWVYGRKRENFHLICQSLRWNLLSAGNRAFVIIYFVVFLIHPFIESICIKDPLGMNLEYNGRGWGMNAKAGHRLYLGETWVQCLHHVALWVSPRGIPLEPSVAQNKNSKKCTKVNCARSVWRSLTRKLRGASGAASPLKVAFPDIFLEKWGQKLTFLGFSGVGASSTEASISLAGIQVS